MNSTPRPTRRELGASGGTSCTMVVPRRQGSRSRSSVERVEGAVSTVVCHVTVRCDVLIYQAVDFHFAVFTLVRILWSL